MINSHPQASNALFIPEAFVDTMGGNPGGHVPHPQYLRNLPLTLIFHTVVFENGVMPPTY